MIRLPVSTIRTISRNTQGVKLINLDDNDSISAVTRVVEHEVEKSDENPDNSSPVISDVGNGED